MGNEHSQLIAFLLSIYPLSKELATSFALHWQEKKVKKKTLLTTCGEKEGYLYFVVSGVQRVYYVSEKGNDATLVFSYNPSFAGIVDSLLTKLPSSYYFETITDSVFLRIRYDVLQEQLLKHREIEQLFFKATAAALKGVLQRQTELLCFSSEEKFTTLLKRSPHLLQLVPQKYLASYLGINSTNFSKFINQIKIG